jgi:hypothetical protein
MVNHADTAGRAAARADGTRPDAPAADGRKGYKAGPGGLRERMRGRGFPCDEIAAGIGRRYRVRPREACQLAERWSLEQAAARFSDRAAGASADPAARAGLTGSRLSELEHGPRNALPAGRTCPFKARSARRRWGRPSSSRPAPAAREGRRDHACRAAAAFAGGIVTTTAPGTGTEPDRIKRRLKSEGRAVGILPRRRLGPVQPGAGE